MQQGFRGVGKVSFIQNPPPPKKHAWSQPVPMQQWGGEGCMVEHWFWRAEWLEESVLCGDTPKPPGAGAGCGGALPGGRHGRCPPIETPPEKTRSTPTAGSAVSAAGGGPALRGGGGPDCWGEGGGKGAATHARPPLALHRAARRARSGRGFAAAAGRCGRAAPAGGPRLAASRDWPGPARLGPLRGTRPRCPLSAPRF